MSDPRRFLANSDYPSDKIFFLKSGTVDVAKSGVSIPHNLGFLPLLDGIWRKVGDSNWYSFGTGPVWMYSPASGVAYPMSDAILLSSDATNMFLEIEDFSNPASSISIEYRVFGFIADENSDTTANDTANQSSGIISSTDQNNRKLLQSGTVTVSAGQSNTIHHALGFLPQIEIWIKGQSYDRIWKFIDVASHESSMAAYDAYQIFADENNLTFVNQDYAGLTYTFYYRIYADEVGAGL